MGRMGCVAQQCHPNLADSLVIARWMEWKPIGFVFVCLCCRLSPKLGETARVYVCVHPFKKKLKNTHFLETEKKKMVVIFFKCTSFSLNDINVAYKMEKLTLYTYFHTFTYPFICTIYVQIFKTVWCTLRASLGKLHKSRKFAAFYTTPSTSFCTVKARLYTQGSWVLSYLHVFIKKNVDFFRNAPR